MLKNYSTTLAYIKANQDSVKGSMGLVDGIPAHVAFALSILAQAFNFDIVKVINDYADI